MILPEGRRDAVRPFPWGTLDVISEEDARAVRALNAWGIAHGRGASVAEALSTLLGARVEVKVRRVHGARPARAADEGVGVILRGSEDVDLRNAALIDVEPALAATLAARSLRRTGPGVLDPRNAAASLAGSLAAIVAAAARRVHANRALSVVAAGPARTLERELAAASGDLLEASLTVIVNDDAYAARLLVPRAAALGAPVPLWTRASLAALGDVRMSLAIVATASRSTAGLIGSLCRGDAWVPETWPLHLTPDGGLAGPVLLAAPSHEIGICATLGEDGRLVVREGSVQLPWTPTPSDDGGSESTRVRGVHEEDGVSDTEKDALVDAVGEVPVVVRVEIGVAEMRAREWASLAPGDVVALGRKIGEGVTLRVGGVTVARGELVDLEGEVAVRLLARTQTGGDR